MSKLSKWQKMYALVLLTLGAEILVFYIITKFYA